MLTAPEPGRDPEPTRTFAFEPLQARELEWLPLAVRFKLDRCGLRVRLRDWQALDMRDRARLLACPEGPTFHQLTLDLFRENCRDDPGEPATAFFLDYLVGKWGVQLRGRT